MAILVRVTPASPLVLTRRLARQPSNPLLDSPSGGPGPREIICMGAGDYRMWYRIATVANEGSSHYATSSDGLSWTEQGEVLPKGAGGAWDATEAAITSVVWDGAQFVACYYGHNADPNARAIGIATSTDGTTWVKHGSNPRLNATETWEDGSILHGHILRLGATNWHLFYMGRGVGAVRKVGHATSTDGLTWTKDAGNPVLTLTDIATAWPAGTVDTFFDIAPYWDGVRFHMWYAAQVAGLNAGIGYVQSDDGVTWTEPRPGPVFVRNLVTGAPDFGAAGIAMSAYRDGDRMRVQYGGLDLVTGGVLTINEATLLVA